jgi:hypothetical protein
MRTHRPLRVLAGVVALAALTAAALWAPIPRLGNPGVARVLGQVHARLPGWSVLSATDTWEGGYAVVASCGARQIGFQVVPGHGLPPQDAWLQPNDQYARSRLQEVSDYSTVLVWRAVPITDRTLSCRQELARSDPGVDGGVGRGPLD